MEFTHLILTRFNVKSSLNDRAAPGTEWLIHRFDLFEQFCMPSVQSQSCQSFTWLVFFDVDTPAVFKEKIAAYAAEWSNFQPCYVDSLPHEKVLSIVREYVDAKYLISTRLDNDDAVAVDFVERVQAHFCHQVFEFVDFKIGYALDAINRKLYTRNYPNHASPFASLIEQSEDFQTVWCGQHIKLHQFGPLRNVRDSPAWLQVMHDQNVLNRIGRWTRVPLHAIQRDFRIIGCSSANDGVAVPLWLENLYTKVRILLSNLRILLREFRS